MLILCPNNEDLSAFDLATKQKSRFMDLLLKMLIVIPEYMLSRYTFRDLRVFIDLLEMGLPSFNSFLDQCYFQTIST